MRAIWWLGRSSGVDLPPVYRTPKVLSYVVFYSDVHRCHEQSENITGERITLCLGALLC